MFLDEKRINQILSLVSDILGTLGKDKKKYVKILLSSLPPGGEAMLELTAPRLPEEIKKRGYDSREVLSDYFRLLQIVQYQKTGGIRAAIENLQNLESHDGIRDVTKTVKSLARGNRMSSFETVEEAHQSVSTGIQSQIKRLEEMGEEEKNVITATVTIQSFMDQFSPKTK